MAAEYQPTNECLRSGENCVEVSRRVYYQSLNVNMANDETAVLAMEEVANSMDQLAIHREQIGITAELPDVLIAAYKAVAVKRASGIRNSCREQAMCKGPGFITNKCTAKSMLA